MSGTVTSETNPSLLAQLRHRWSARPSGQDHALLRKFIRYERIG